jgi:gamma-glutamylcyclotransferase
LAALIKQELYFAYGSNLSSEQMLRRCPDSTPLDTAYLAGYELCFPFSSATWGGKGVAGIQPHQDRNVYGVVYQMSEQSLMILDQYEGHPFKYCRKRLKVLTSDNASTDVWIYIPMTDRSHDFYHPSRRYIAAIIRGAMEHSLPSKYLNFLKFIPTASRNTDYNESEFKDE